MLFRAVLSLVETAKLLLAHNIIISVKSKSASNDSRPDFVNNRAELGGGLNLK